MIARTIPKWDLDLSKPKGVSGIEYAAQKIRQKLLMLKGEWFLDQNLGIPWVEEVLIKNPSLEFIRSVVRKTVLSVPGIISCPYVTVTEPDENRNSEVTFKAIFLDGQPIDATLLVEVM
jgi:hypothetical protein